MTVPDFPHRLRDAEGPRRPDGGARPAPHRDRQGRQRAPLRPPGHRRARAAGDAARAVRRGAGHARRRTSTGWTPSRPRSPPFTPERAEAPAASPPTRSARLAREFAGGRRGRGRTAGSGCPPRRSARCASGRSRCSTCSPATSTGAGGAMFTTPAIDAVGRGLIGRGHHDAWRSRVRGLPEFGGELPVAALPRRSLTPGEGQVRAMLTLAGNPVLSTPDGRAARRGAGRAGLHGGGRHLRQRDHPARRRDPAADDGAGAGPLRPGLPPARGAQHRPVHARRCSPSRPGRAARLGDLPRDRAAHDGAGSTRRPAAEASGSSSRARLPAQPDPDWSPCCCARGRSRLSVRQLRAQPDGVDLGPLEPCLPGAAA